MPGINGNPTTKKIARNQRDAKALDICKSYYFLHQVIAEIAACPLCATFPRAKLRAL